MSRHARGIPVSGGIAIGPGWIYRPTIVNVERRIDQDPEIERRRLVSALAAARDQISRLRQATREQLGQEQAAIFEAHLLILEDPEFIGRINDAIAADRINAEAALAGVVEEYAQMMLALSDEYFQARAQDIRDVGHRLLCCLSGAEVGGAEMPDQPVIVLAEDLTPSDTVQFDRARVLGLCTLRGGPTSHTAILARSLGVPAVVNLALPLEDLHDGVPLILDGSAGELIIDPVPEEIGKARRDRSEQRALWAEQLSAAALPAATTDGRVVEVAANIGSVEDARQAIDFGAEGVGLLRTEFLYLNRERLPSLEEQVGVYQEIFTVMGNRPVVVRTLDIGGDKAVDYLGIQHEPNPFLGWRAIRMIDEKPEILRDQFSALLLAGRGVDLRIMIPLVASLEEVLGARQLFDQACQSLQLIGRPVAERVQFGIMIEVPSAALLAGHLAEHVDFFSIGTNDLAQYTLAVDRTNERVAHLASPFHPAVLNLIAQTIQAAHSRGKWVGLCGEMAGDPRATPLLLGLGLDEFSMAPASIPIVKQRIRQLAFKDCREIAAAALKLPTTRAVLDYLDEVTPSAK
jgi:phosphoenolpyruvate-protein phosphotransferase